MTQRIYIFLLRHVCTEWVYGFTHVCARKVDSLCTCYKPIKTYLLGLELTIAIIKNEHMNIKKRKVFSCCHQNYDLLRHNIERQKSSPASSLPSEGSAHTNTLKCLIEREHIFYIPPNFVRK